jgi:hypothetical protein
MLLIGTTGRINVSEGILTSFVDGLGTCPWACESTTQNTGREPSGVREPLRGVSARKADRRLGLDPTRGFEGTNLENIGLFPKFLGAGLR